MEYAAVIIAALAGAVAGVCVYLAIRLHLKEPKAKAKPKLWQPPT
jgi:hypothetical protein